MDWEQLVFSEDPFEERMQRLFNWQFENNAVYRRYCEALAVTPGAPTGRPSGWTPPLLPVRAFRDADLSCLPGRDPELIFHSSGTSDRERSRHFVYEPELYRQSLLRGFRQFYDLDKAVILGFTPGYSENPHSSLIWMLRELIAQDDSGLSRFLPLGEPLKKETVKEIAAAGRRLILFGAAFGLVDLAKRSSVTLPADSVVIETGGMKTHRREMSRGELHSRLGAGFKLAEERVHSEYGMAELLSQAYATGSHWFRTVPWMKVSVRDADNPQRELPPYSEGLIGVVDLANVHSCAFLLTGDRGMMDRRGRFQVLGRWHPRDLRGCNFLVEED